MSVMVRQVFALFDEYQSKENAKHTLRAMQENARQGFWNGSKAPYGYAVIAADSAAQRRKSGSPSILSKSKSSASCSGYSAKATECQARWASRPSFPG
jgi:DNA invertase Pin-like site-specific DNA recombinase